MEREPVRDRADPDQVFVRARQDPVSNVLLAVLEKIVRDRFSRSSEHEVTVATCEPARSSPRLPPYRAIIDGVEQLTRYLALLNRDPLLTSGGPVRGIFAAQVIKPQARVLAEDRGITCAVVDYDALRGLDDPTERLF